MASFPICPLINQKVFLGVTDDCTPGCIIVSLGKKIIIRFRLDDQKQLSCWTPKRTLSTPVFYDHDRKEYFAVFNSEILTRWSSFDRRNFSKFKLPGLVHSLYYLPGTRPILLFKDGNVALLDNADKKSINILKNIELSPTEIEDIKAFFCGVQYLCFVCTEGKHQVIKFVSISNTDDGSFSFKAVRKENECKLSCFTVLEEKSQLITLWKDGSLYSFDLNDTSRKKEDFPGSCITTFKNINCALPCVILPLGNHVVVYGADSNGEGAKVVWVEAAFGVIQNSLHLKLYSSPPHMWKVSNSYLITNVGQNLTVIPYTLKSVPKLESLLAAHCTSELTTNRVSWEETKKKADKYFHGDDESDLTKKIVSGYPEYTSCQNVIDSLLEKGRAEDALHQLENLTDIPDKYIIDIVVRCLKSSDNKPNPHLLMKALSFPLLNNSETLSLLRNQLSFDAAISLLSFISDEMEKEQDNDFLINWLTLLMDTHYQEYLLTKDDRVENQLSALKQHIDSLVSNMISLQELYKLLTGILNTRVISKTSVQYSVDKFRLY